MVSTRSHPSTFPLPDDSPSKTPARSSRSARAREWTHIPDRITLLWLIISLPLVIWDAGYVLLRPHSMPGGKFHTIWTPYALYGQVDYIYGEKAWNEHNGFTAAQTMLNILETIGYLAYLWVVLKFGEGEKRTIGGGWGGVACLAGFALSIMTVSKTVLYGSNEYFSGFENIGHNDASTILFLWILPNGLWLIFPSYAGYDFGRSILSGLAIASGDSSSKPARLAAPIKDE